MEESDRQAAAESRASSYTAPPPGARPPRRSTTAWPVAAALAGALALAWGLGHHAPAPATPAPPAAAASAASVAHFARAAPIETTAPPAAPAPEASPAPQAQAALSAAAAVETPPAEPAHAAALDEPGEPSDQLTPVGQAQAAQAPRAPLLRPSLLSGSFFGQGAPRAGFVVGAAPLREVVLRASDARRSGAATVFDAGLIPRDANIGDSTEIVDVAVDGGAPRRITLTASAAPLELAVPADGGRHTLTLTGVKVGDRFHDICVDIATPAGLLPSHGMRAGEVRVFPIVVTQ